MLTLCGVTTSAACAGLGVEIGVAVGLGVAVGFGVGATLCVGFGRGVLTGVAVARGVGVAGTTASPLSATAIGARVESLAIVKAPLRIPLLFGANVTPIVQLWPAFSAPEQLLTAEKPPLTATVVMWATLL